MAEHEPRQLYSNIMFALEEGGVLAEGDSPPAKTEEIASYLKAAILVSRSDTRLYFLDSRTLERKDIALTDIALDAEGNPEISVSIGIEPYAGDMAEYVFFGWKTKDGTEYSASYPNMAFYTTED